MKYRVQPARTKQARGIERDEIRSEFNISNYFSHSVVDRVVLRVRRPERVYPIYLKYLIDRKASNKRAYVEEAPDSSRRPGWEYLVTLQDPTHNDIMSVVTLDGSFEVVVEEVEVAVDFYPHKRFDEAEKQDLRRQLLVGLVRHLHIDPQLLERRGCPRYNLGKEKNYFLRPDIDADSIHVPHIHRAPHSATFYFCEQDTDLAFKIYEKRDDERKGAIAKALPAFKHRVRFEMNIRGELLTELHMRDPVMLKEAPFEKLVDFFELRVPTVRQAKSGVDLMTRVWNTRRDIAIYEFLRAGYHGFTPFDTKKDERGKRGRNSAFPGLRERFRKPLVRLNMP